ncbi:MAG: hypothetical protein A2621_02245 [Alphaproteobacteria bacterium RIFCSPHIGHO2_01_FULL_41_14]|nr:MAG: hypothetical protein A2065_01505 [Alphaproteobacteria bacterium GWB1_45_5]OFW76620.1 MAG: hypothetical protein A3K20_00355 [Alphaproteobacteria bacterium GWA1_45_9]OFW89704.1 MAG: hypothetical protein A2621_02245 [Alphaproteobacteria bacterium RIFCSPHIGHO2_01_FULL_41_14]HCI49149.1 hypothetical protein [Holosporales bacterium]
MMRLYFIIIFGMLLLPLSALAAQGEEVSMGVDNQHLLSVSPKASREEPLDRGTLLRLLAKPSSPIYTRPARSSPRQNFLPTARCERPLAQCLAQKRQEQKIGEALGTFASRSDTSPLAPMTLDPSIALEISQILSGSFGSERASLLKTKLQHLRDDHTLTIQQINETTLQFVSCIRLSQIDGELFQKRDQIFRESHASLQAYFLDQEVLITSSFPRLDQWHLHIAELIARTYETMVIINGETTELLNLLPQKQEILAKLLGDKMREATFNTTPLGQIRSSALHAIYLTLSPDYQALCDLNSLFCGEEIDVP